MMMMNDCDLNNVNVSSNERILQLSLHGEGINCAYCEIEDIVKTTVNEHEFCSLHINIHSLPAKFDQLKNILARLRDLNILVDFVLLCETFLTESNKDLYQMPGYKMFSLNRTSKSKGGVVVYVHEKYSTVERSDLCVDFEGEFESLLVEIQFTNLKGNIVVGEVYRVPGTNEQLSIQRYEQFLGNIERAKF